MLTQISQMLFCYNNTYSINYKCLILRRQGPLGFGGPAIQNLNAGAPKRPAYDPGHM